MTNAKLLLISGFLLAEICYCQGFLGFNWMDHFAPGIDQLNQRLQADITRMNRELQANVNAQVAQVQRTVDDALKNIKKVEIPPWQPSSGPSSSGSGYVDNVSLFNRNGNSVIVHWGQDKRGKPFRTETERRHVGDKIEVTERHYNYKTNRFDERKYIIDD